SLTFPLEGVAAEVEAQKPGIAEVWQRWNDYGIGLFLEGQGAGSTPGGRVELKQARHAFAEVEKLGRFDGPRNLARVYEKEGRCAAAVAARNRVAGVDKPAAPPWTIAYYSGLVNRQQGHFDEAIENFRSVLYDETTERRDRNFHLMNDFIAHNDLGLALF